VAWRRAQVERYSGKVQLTLVWNAETFKDATPLLPRLAKKVARPAVSAAPGARRPGSRTGRESPGARSPPKVPGGVRAQLTAEGAGLFHSIWGNLRTGGGNAILERDPLRQPVARAAPRRPRAAGAR